LNLATTAVARNVASGDIYLLHSPAILSSNDCASTCLLQLHQNHHGESWLILDTMTSQTARETDTDARVSKADVDHFDVVDETLDPKNDEDATSLNDAARGDDLPPGYFYSVRFLGALAVRPLS
jgi:hypothetical protein